MQFSDDDNSLSVGVIETSYTFTRCYGSMPPLADASCRHLLIRIDARDADLKFGPQSDAGVDVVLPISLVSREYYIYHGQGMSLQLIAPLEDRRCALNIYASRGAEVSSWWAIWVGM